MFWKKQKEETETTKRAAIVTAFFVILIAGIVIVTPVFAYNFIYEDKIYQGVSIDGVSVGNLMPSEARSKIESFVNDMDRSGLTFKAKNKKISFKEFMNTPAS